MPLLVKQLTSDRVRAANFRPLAIVNCPISILQGRGLVFSREQDDLDDYDIAYLSAEAGCDFAVMRYANEPGGKASILVSSELNYREDNDALVRVIAEALDVPLSAFQWRPNQANEQTRSVPAQAPRPNSFVRTAETVEKRTLMVGRGISLCGSIKDAERLVVSGLVEAATLHASELSVAQGGVVRGDVVVVEAEIAGTFDGTLLATGSLIVRHSGILIGTSRCRRLMVEDGGQITGRVETTAAAHPTDQLHYGLAG